MLFRATTAMGLFERALEERGIPVHVVGGRGYWGQQQVLDLRHWLAALANPLDGLAVYSVLASPLAGLSLDGVALIGLRARGAGRDPWWAISAALGRDAGEPDTELLEQLPAGDRGRLVAFADRFEAERRIAGQVSLETLIDRAVTLTGYDRHLLALPGGTRRMANVRKLMRMAREYEADEGRNLRGFIDALAERDALQTREGEAPLETEDLNAVRMMTVHRAKGLEFPVVCLADLGKDGRDDDGSLRISEDGSVGLRLAGLGGGAVDSARLERIKAEGRVAAEEEERRIFYVAATRAQEHLVLSGATDLAKRQDPADLQEPMRWIWRGFCAELPTEGTQGIHVDEREGREVAVRWTMCTPANVDEVLPAADRAPRAPETEEAPSYEQPLLELGMLPAPRALPVSRLSYSGLEAYRRCGYRFYLQRALRLAPVATPAGAPAAEPGISALLRGTVVHGLLERLDFARPAVPSEEDVAAAIEQHGIEALPADVVDVRDMVERLAGCGADEPDRCGRPRAHGAALRVHARCGQPQPAHQRSRGRAWPTRARARSSSTGRAMPSASVEPEELTRDHYATQRIIYALAALRAGAERVEVVHCYLERPDEPAVAHLRGRGQGSARARAASSLAHGVVEGRFEPSSEPHFSLCADCPGRAALCVHESELTLRLSVGTPS